MNPSNRNTDRPITITRTHKIVPSFGCGKSTFYANIKAGLLPPLVKLGPRMSGLPDHEIDAINRARIAGKSDDEIRQLVRTIVAARTQSAQAA